MKTAFKRLFILFLSITLNGCAHIDRYMLKPSAEASRVPPLFLTKGCKNFVPVNENDAFDFHNPFVKNDCEAQLYSLNEDNITSVCKGTSSTGLQECSAYLIRTSDNICNVHLSSIFGNRAVTNVSLGILATGAGIAGGLVSGLAAANALSGAAGFLTGTRSLMNEEIYRNYVAEAIIKEILANRNTKKDEIKRDLLTSSQDNQDRITGVEQIKQRVSEYHSECSFYSGLSSLLGKAGLPKDPPEPNLKDSPEDQTKNLNDAKKDSKSDEFLSNLSPSP